MVRDPDEGPWTIATAQYQLGKLLDENLYEAVSNLKAMSDGAITSVPDADDEFVLDGQQYLVEWRIVPFGHYTPEEQ